MDRPEVRNSLLDYIDKQFAEIHKEWEEYHKQEMDKIKQSRSVEKIRELLYTRKAYSETWGDWCNKVAKKISKSIIGK